MKLSFNIEDLSKKASERENAREALVAELYEQGRTAWLKQIEDSIKGAMERRNFARENMYCIHILYTELARCHLPFDNRIAPLLVKNFNRENPGFTMKQEFDSSDDNAEPRIVITWTIPNA